MTTVKIEVARVNVNNRLSEETICFSADLLVNGKKVGTTGNRGCGGCDEVHLLPDCGWTEASLNEAVKASYGRMKPCEYFPEGLEYDLDLVVGELVENVNLLKELRRACKKNVCVLDGDKKGSYRTFSWKGVKAVTPEMISGFLAKKPEFVGKVMNLMTDEELLAKFK